MNRRRLLLSVIGPASLIGGILAAARWPPSEVWANGVLSATFVILGLVAVVAVIRRGRGGAYPLGFALFGWAYLAAILGPWLGDHVAPMLLSETAMKALQHHFGPYLMTQGAVYDLGEQVRYAPRQIGHALIALLLGMLGGTAALAFEAGPGADG